jgi:hypothetical protein
LLIAVALGLQVVSAFGLDAVGPVLLSGSAAGGHREATVAAWRSVRRSDSG